MAEDGEASLEERKTICKIKEDMESYDSLKHTISGAACEQRATRLT